MTVGPSVFCSCRRRFHKVRPITSGSVRTQTPITRSRIGRRTIDRGAMENYQICSPFCSNQNHRILRERLLTTQSPRTCSIEKAEFNRPRWSEWCAFIDKSLIQCKRATTKGLLKRTKQGDPTTTTTATTTTTHRYVPMRSRQPAGDVLVLCCMRFCRENLYPHKMVTNRAQETYSPTAENFRRHTRAFVFVP